MIRIRPYKECDGEKIVSWIPDEKGFYQWSAGQLGTYPPSKDLLNDYRKSIANDDSIFQMTACNSNGPIGYLTMQFIDEDRKVMRFNYVIIDNEKRGRGYGRRVLKQALTYAFDMLQVEKVTLGVFENNLRGYMCYQAAGFEEVPSEEQQYIEIGGEKWPCKELETRSVTGNENQKKYHLSEEKAISNIIDDNSFKYAFQPIVSASSGEIYAYEALMRADVEEPISPQLVLDYATRANRLYDIEKATFYNVLRDVDDRKTEFQNRKVFINSIPGFQLANKDYGDFKKKYREYLQQITVEITEATELKDNELDVLLKRSKNDGFGLAIDDYGTGYSNTANLLRVLPDCVKIDRLLISDIHQDLKKQHFVNSIIEFAHDNGFMALAEGVETGAELKTIIHMGVDLIQGFYTARPSFEILQEIDAEIRNEIINSNVRGQTIAARKVYHAVDEAEIPLMRIALEQNTGILVEREELTIIGNENYEAAMSIKIKDGLDCKLIFQNVHLESFQELPCIEIGENAHLTLVLEGVNKISKYGILVPESSSVRLEGNGEIYFRMMGIQSYAIGNTWDAAVGNITLACKGFVDMLVEAESGIGVGGGIYNGNSKIEILAGKVRVEHASSRGIGIGGVKGNVPILIKNADVYVDMKVERGIGIGCLEDKADVQILSARSTMTGYGTAISSIGSYGVGDADITIDSTEIYITSNGQFIYMIGSASGNVNVNMNNSILELKGEGAEVLGIGSRSGHGKVAGNRTNCSINIRSGGHMLFGAKDEDVVFVGGLQNLKANE